MIRFAYAVGGEKKGWAQYTAAYERFSDGVWYAVSRCAPEDAKNFTKHEGRNRALARYNEGGSCKFISATDIYLFSLGNFDAFYEGKDRMDPASYKHWFISECIFRDISKKNVEKGGCRILYSRSHYQALLNEGII